MSDKSKCLICNDFAPRTGHGVASRRQKRGIQPPGRPLACARTIVYTFQCIQAIDLKAFFQAGTGFALVLACKLFFPPFFRARIGWGCVPCHCVPR